MQVDDAKMGANIKAKEVTAGESPTYIKNTETNRFPYLWAIQGLNLGPPDYESVGKYTERCSPSCLIDCLRTSYI